MAGLVREYNYAVDQWTLSSTVMPEVFRRIDAQVEPLARQRGLQVARESAVVKTGSGQPVAGLQNMTWKARKGMSAGFTIKLEHGKGNYLNVKVRARPFYPLAYVMSVALGLLISYMWIPYLSANFDALLHNPIFILLVIVMYIVIVFATRLIFISAILAILSTWTFGFLAGYAIGWGVGSVVADSKSGGKIRPALVQVIAGLEQSGGAPSPPPAGWPAYAPPSAPGAYAPAYAPAYGAPQAPPAYAPAPSRPPRPTATGTYATPPPLKVAKPVAVATSSPPASGALPPCPKCGKGVSPNAASCGWCGQPLVW